MSGMATTPPPHPAWDAWPAAKVATPSADLTASPGARGGPARAPHRNQSGGDQLVAGCGFRLRVPELIPPRWPSSSSPLPNALPRGPNAERLEEPSAGEPAGGRGSTRAPRPPRLQGKFLAARGGALGGRDPGAEGPRASAKSRRAEAGSPELRPERPFWAGSPLGAEGGAEVVSLARCRQVPARTRALRRSGAQSPGHSVRFPGRPGGWLQSCQGAVVFRPPRAAIPAPRPPRGGPGPGTGGHNSSEVAVTPGGSRCPCTGNAGRVWKTQDPRWPWEQVQSELSSWEAAANYCKSCRWRLGWGAHRGR